MPELFLIRSTFFHGFMIACKPAFLPFGGSWLPGSAGWWVTGSACCNFGKALLFGNATSINEIMSLGGLYLQVVYIITIHNTGPGKGKHWCSVF